MGVIVLSVVTDKASNMSPMRQYLSKPLLHVYDCQAQAMNLVAKDASGTAKPLILKVTSILKHLRNHHADSADLQNVKVLRPPLPVDTRWNSVTDSWEYFKSHWSNISVIFEKTLGPQDTQYIYMEQIQRKEERKM